MKTVCCVWFVLWRIIEQELYLSKKNRQIRGLIIPYMKGFSNDICKNTLVGWISCLIKLVFQKCQLHIIQLSAAKPHEVKTMSASLAWRATVGLQDILSAASWSNHTSFISFYLKDITIVKDEIHSLGPLVAAKKVISLRCFLISSCTLYIFHFEWESPVKGLSHIPLLWWRGSLWVILYPNRSQPL